MRKVLLQSEAVKFARRTPGFHTAGLVRACYRLYPSGYSGLIL